MFGNDYKKQRAGQPISARKLNQAGPVLDRLMKSRAGVTGIGSFSAPFGTNFRLDTVDITAAMTPDGGIRKRSTSGVIVTAVCFGVNIIDNGDGTMGMQIGDEADSYTVANLSSQDVAGNTLVLIQRINDIWVCVWEDCKPT